MKPYTVLAFDLGASSGRAIKARFQDNVLNCQEVHRFENKPVEKDGTLCWDFTALEAEIHTGIEKAGEFDSVGFDTWGVDFGLLDEHGVLLSAPVHYRDTRTNGIPERVFPRMGKEELYRNTGNQIMPINTLFQLMALKEQQPEQFEQAKTLLFMPDLFAYVLTGNPCCEQTIASTSQMFNPLSGLWSDEVLESCGIDPTLLLKPVPSGTITGTYQNASVIAVAGHDTQCAVAAVPTNDSDVAFLSCGTWSLLGTEQDAPILTKESMEMELSNEVGANGKINYLKNIIGLWLIQESRRQYRRQGEEYSFSQLEQLASQASPRTCFIDPDAPEFGIPGDIPALVKAYCKRTKQHIPETVGEVMRCIYESLALKYRLALDQLEAVTGTEFSALHMLGGGIQAKLLCQLTANSCRKTVVAGPIEATALGNIIIQLVALGALESIEQGRLLIAKSEPLIWYQPGEAEEWEQALQTYRNILEGGTQLEISEDRNQGSH